MTEHSDIVRQLGKEDCPACVGTGNFYGNDEDGDFLPCDECDGTGFLKIAPSFNGRTSGSEPEYGGSNPSGAAKI